MIKRSLIIFTILLSTLALSLVYREEAPLRLLTVELIFVAVIIILAIVNAVTIKFKVWTAPAKIKIDDTKVSPFIRVSFTGGIFLLPANGVLELSVSNVRGNELPQKIEVPFNSCRRHNDIRFPITVGAVGLLEIKPVAARFFEPTGLIGIRKKIEAEAKRILVFPATYSVRVNNCMGKKYNTIGSDDSDFYSDHPGDDPSEIFDYREFRDGDRLSRVNWKLSAREKQLMVKEMSDPIQEPVCITLGISSDNVLVNNGALGVINSVSASLVNENIRFAFLVKRNNEYELLHVKDIETKDEAMIPLLNSDVVSVNELEGLLGDELLSTFSMILYVTEYAADIKDLVKRDERERVNIFAITSSNEKTRLEKVNIFNVDKIKNELEKLWLDIS